MNYADTFESANAYKYARDVIHGRYIEGEPDIAKDIWFSCMYAEDILEGRFELAEPLIATDIEYAFPYARDVIKGRFPMADQLILNSEYKIEYLESFSLKDLAELKKVGDHELLMMKLKFTDEVIRKKLLKGL